MLAAKACSRRELLTPLKTTRAIRYELKRWMLRCSCSTAIYFTLAKAMPTQLVCLRPHPRLGRRLSHWLILDADYFLRALALDLTNPMIKLSLALGYLHYALKRQADNRHHILMQGLAFLLEYYDCRQLSGKPSEKQEAEFNVAHAYHLLGLSHLAIPYYERCLAMSGAAQIEDSGCEAEIFAKEAAFALQSLWAASDNMCKARELTKKWLLV